MDRPLTVFSPNLFLCNEPVMIRFILSYLDMEPRCDEPVCFSILFFYLSIFFYFYLLLSCCNFFFQYFSFHLYCSQSKESIVKARKYSLLFFLSLFFVPHKYPVVLYHTVTYFFPTCVFSRNFLDFLFFVVIMN